MNAIEKLNVIFEKRYMELAFSQDHNWTWGAYLKSIRCSATTCDAAVPARHLLIRDPSPFGDSLIVTRKMAEKVLVLGGLP